MSKTAKIVITIIAVLVVAWFGYASFKRQQTGGEPIKIGTIFALSGSAAYWGQDTLRAVEIAVDETNQAGGINGRKVELINEDAPAAQDLQKGVSAFQKLVNVDKVNIILGPTWDDEAQALAPLADRTKTILISPDTSSGVEKNKDYLYFFSTALPEKAETLRMAQYVKENGWLKIGVIRNDDPFSTIIREKLEEEGKTVGVSIVKDIAITDTGSKDFRTYITIIKSQNIDALYIVFNDEASKCPFLQQAKELGLTKPILSTLSTQSPDSLAKCGSIMEGIKYTYQKQGDKYAALLKKYRDKYGMDPTSPATADAYDAANIVIDQLRARRLTSDAIREGILAVKNYSGATGDNISFSPNGYFVLPSAGFLIKTVHNSQFEVIEQ